MSWFANINSNNMVEQVIFVANQHGEEGERWCTQNFGGTWKETFENGRFRKRFASYGQYYNPETDEFNFARPYPSWIWSTEHGSWVAPVDPPMNNLRYRWIEATQSWESVNS